MVPASLLGKGHMLTMKNAELFWSENEMHFNSRAFYLQIFKNKKIPRLFHGGGVRAMRHVSNCTLRASGMSQSSGTDRLRDVFYRK